jgi:small subunit ribosomal protein S10
MSKEKKEEKTKKVIQDQQQKKDVQEEVEYKPRIRIKIKSYDHRIIDLAVKSVIDAIGRSGANIIGPIPLPTEKKIYTVLRSTFVHKNSRDQFEVRVHKRLIEIVDPGPKTIETLTNLSLPSGVDVEIKTL